MRKSIIAVSILLAGAANANDTETTVTISGQLTPTSCELAVTNAAVDLGNISTQSLAGGRTVEWGEDVAPRITITCTGDTLAAFSLTDNRTDTLDALDAVDAFGLGRFNAGADQGNPIGVMSLSLANVSIENVDGIVDTPGDLLRYDNGLNDPGNPAQLAFETQLLKSTGVNALYTFGAMTAGAQLLAFDLLGSLQLQDANQIAEGFDTAEHTIDGNFTVTAHF